MPLRTEPLFLARETYRRRRVMDAARLLPFLALFLFIAPVLWPKGTHTLSGMFYLFGAWIVLIAIMAWLAPALRPPRSARPTSEDPGASEGD